MSGPDTRSHDVIILGGGPAGLTAAIYLARARLKALVLETGVAGGQMVLSYKVANYPGVEETSGAAISQVMLRQAREFGAEVITQAEITELSLEGDLKRVVVEDEGTFTAPAVILAVGGTPRRLGLENETRFQGTGISYCATCDGDQFTGRPIAVIGGGNSALEEAIALTKYASRVTIIHEFDHFQAQQWIVEKARQEPKIDFLMNQRVLAFEGGDSLTAVVSEDKATGQRNSLPVDGCFIFIGYIPNTAAFAGMVKLTPSGEIVTDDTLATSQPGVFAAGDARFKRYRQITTAVSDGTIAALTVAEQIEAHPGY
jgi:thioredoxin reductase (NADPH)